MDIHEILSGKAVRITGFDEELNPEIEVTTLCDEHGNRARFGDLTLHGLSAHHKIALRAAWMSGAEVVLGRKRDA